MPASVAEQEHERLAALQRTGLLDTLPEEMFDDIAQLAALICETPVALISLVDEHRQWFKSRVGLAATETPRDQAFCAHAIQSPQAVFVVGDALTDPRFADNPLVMSDPHIRFYAGAPIVDAQGLALGTVCVIDRQPRELSPQRLQALQALSRQVSRLIAWRQLVKQEQRALHDQLQQQHLRLFQATASATEDLALKVYVDRDHVVRYVNNCFLRYWKLLREQVEGRPLQDLIGTAAYETTERSRLDQALAGHKQHYQSDVVYPEQGARHMALSYLPVLDSQCQVCAVVVRAQDVHEVEEVRLSLAQANAELTKRNDMQARFIHMMSHDLREPVNSIVNFTGLLVEDLDPQLNDLSRKHLRFVQQGGERMRTLLDDLLDYVRLEGSDGQALHQQPVDLNDVMRDVMADLDSRLSQSKGVLVPGHLPTVVGDRSLLRVLLQNLVSNALKFHSPGLAPQVSWGSQAEGQGHTLWVCDRGIGIAPEQLHKLFGPFSRLVTRKEFSGTGLGLAIAKRIADLHGARIQVKSEPGRGSTFSVWLPATAIHEEPKA